MTDFGFFGFCTISGKNFSLNYFCFSVLPCETLLCSNQRVMAKPVDNRKSRAIPSDPKYWINPCGYALLPLQEVPTYSDSKYAETLALQPGLDIGNVDNWKNSFVSI